MLFTSTAFLYSALWNSLGKFKPHMLLLADTGFPELMQTLACGQQLRTAPSIASMNRNFKLITTISSPDVELGPGI
jgi:hypothetical protein